MSTDPSQPDPGDLLADLLGLAPRVPVGMSEIETAFVGRYGGPNSLQRRVQAVVRQSGSCLVVAPPASGKTEAAVMPLAELQRRSEGLILYVCPTRALINDVVARLEPGFDMLGRTVVARHGESKKSAGAYTRASCIVVTPESLESMAAADDQLIDSVPYMVLDELDSVDGTARGTQLRILLGRLRVRTRASIVTVGITATVSDPERVAKAWAAPEKPFEVVIQEGRSSRPHVRVFPGGTDGLRTWLQRREAPAKVLVFTNSRKRCDELYLGLKGSSRHVPLIHYSDLERAERVATERLLRELPSVLCIATSTLELGIDVGDIDSVVLADAPWSTRNLVQRIGRSGRRSGDMATAFFPLKDHDFIRAVAALTTPVHEDDDGVSPIFPSVLVQQVLVRILADQRRRISVGAMEAATAAVGIAGAWAGKLLTHLRDLDILMMSPGGRKYELTPAAERLLGRDLWGNFPANSGGWDLRTAGRHLATVHLSSKPAAGLGLLFAGRTWRVVSVQRRTLGLVPDDNVNYPESPVYRDPTPLVSGRLAEQMRCLLTGEAEPAGVEFDDEVEARFNALRSQLGGLVRDAVVLIAEERGPKLLTFGGSRANHLLAALLPESTGADDLGIFLSRDISEQRWAMVAAGSTDATAIAAQAWERLAGQVALNRWFEYLPPPLKRDEVVSQFVSPRVAERVAATAQRPLVVALTNRMSL